ncbi:MAG: (2Fe-2S) ferredoxin domain-containing protein [Sphingomonas sp.]|nr:(2Fe-2S) ferredoxin domain-containing protein [Sphingomonas sp.]
MKPRVAANWRSAILVCAKCSRRLDGGFGPKGNQPLGKALRKHLGVKKGRKARVGIVDVKCLGICPRGAVTVIDGAASREWLLIPAGTDLDAVAKTLGLD